MSADVIISVENLGKSYQLRHQGERQRYVALRDVLAQKLQAPFKLLLGRQKAGEAAAARRAPQDNSGALHEEFWALRDVSFEVKRGDVMGIIGRNGAGKSTLLKILSRITEPTEGRVHLKGRVASLLEVGTGFHPELTGRENIFLNGAILGMSREEIRRKFDEMVAFAEVEKFLDTPVKRYSSGMYVRLAFAVAAHLEPEILIVDEVLAVGDAEFQKKCLGKMRQVSQGGRTVLFVSHNMSAVTALCSVGLVMDKGGVLFRGNVDASIGHYLRGPKNAIAVWEKPSSAGAGASLSFNEIRLKMEGAQPDVRLNLQIQTLSVQKHRPAFLAVDILDSAGTVIMQAIPTFACFIDGAVPLGQYQIIINLPPLVPGNYSVTLWMGPHNAETYDQVANAVSFEIAESPTIGRSYPHTRDHGFIVPASQYQVLTGL